jgi:hypothetical protein
MAVRRPLRIENAIIPIRNFSGVAGQYNPVGYRNFCVLLEPEIAASLKADGWNVKVLKPRSPEDQEQAYLPVAVAFSHYPPEIYLIKDGKKRAIYEPEVNILDWAEFENVDIVISPSNWDMNGKHGVKAYLKVMYATVIPDAFAEKYKDVPDSASSSAFDKDESPI